MSSREQDKLCAELVNIKADRHIEDHAIVMSDRFETLIEIRERFMLSRPYGESIPSVAELVRVPEIKTLIEDTPLAEELTEESFSHIVDILPLLTKDWRNASESALLAKLLDQQKDKDIELGVKQLHYATSGFQCKYCKLVLHYPAILSHHCHHEFDFDSDSLSVLQCIPLPWTAEDFDVRPHAKSWTSKILKSLGLPATTTQKDMDAMGYLECLDCSACGSNRERVVHYDWRSMVQHSHGERHTVSRLNYVDTTRAKAYIGAENPDSLTICVTCRELVTEDCRETHGEM